jgi:hypothetical protein
MARQLQRLLLQHHNTRACCKPLKGLQAAQLRVSIASQCSIVGCTSDMPPSTGAHATPAGNNWTTPHPTYRVRPHQTVGLDGCQLLFPVAKWVGVYRSVQRPHPIAPQAAVFEYLDKWNERMFFIRDHNHVVVVFDGRVNPLKRRERTQNDIAKTAAAEQTLQDAVNARADDEKYCDYRQEDWAAFRSRVDAAQLCVARYDNLLITTFKAWVAARGCVVLGGCVIGGTVLCGGRVLRWDARQSELTCFSTGNVCAVRVCRSFQGGLRAL